MPSREERLAAGVWYSDHLCNLPDILLQDLYNYRAVEDAAMFEAYGCSVERSK